MRLCAGTSDPTVEEETPNPENAPELYGPTLQFLNDYFVPSNVPPDGTAPTRTAARTRPAAHVISPETTAATDTQVPTRHAGGAAPSARATDAPTHVVVNEDDDDGATSDGASTDVSLAPMPVGGGHCVELRDLVFLDIATQREKGNGVALYDEDGGIIPVGDGGDPSSAPSGAGGAGRKQGSDDVTEATPLARIFLLLCRLAVPVALSQLLRGSMGFITTIFMGHYLTTNLFAAATTGLAFTNLTALSIGSGFCAALDTLATQEHGRRKHSPEIAAILMRSLFCTFVVYIPMALLYTFSAPVLALMIHKDLVDDTAFFLRMSVFIIVPMLFTNNLLKFAQSQRVTQMSLITTGASAVSLPILLFIFGRTGGVGGIIAAMALSRVIELVIVIGYILAHPGLRSCFQGYTLKEHVAAVVTNTGALCEFVRVGLPVLAAFCADSWSFEVLSIVCAHISPMCSALWGVAMSLYNVLFALAYGVGSAGAIRVGNAVGARKGLVAHKYSIAVLLLATIVSALCSLLIGFFGGPIYSLMQSNAEVTVRGAQAAPIIGVTFFFDMVFYCLQGSFRGIGENTILLYIVCLSMWGVTVPLGFVLGIILDYDFEGVVISLGVGVAVAAPMALVYLNVLFDWTKFEGPETPTESSVSERENPEST